VASETTGMVAYLVVAFVPIKNECVAVGLWIYPDLKHAARTTVTLTELPPDAMVSADVYCVELDVGLAAVGGVADRGAADRSAQRERLR
jgi:hypothetical protein